MNVRITLPEMQRALARVKPREGVTFVELEGVETLHSYVIDFKQFNFFKNLLLHKLTAQSPCQRALHCYLLGTKLSFFYHITKHNK